jgi:mannose-6-phosphate isomerase-like protein (cupin superfamily)
MRTVFIVAALFTAAGLLGAAAQSTTTVTYVDQDKVAKGGSLATAPDYSASMNRRNGAGQVEVHEKETDIFYVTEGEATFVTGGTIIGAKSTRPNQLLGTDIQGGQTHQLKKGDVIVIPAGVPHWFKEVPKTIQYFVVKSIKP